ncbi:hypothetical protein Cgig2_024590 [Carnegiea gigantea]|uniref:Uncharacterized protein n=1 Tax=Carnegiea gigantea TaxID=171969 RepID=A0A9Q1KK11_9CARY|nr:hypothetical protein Cgig2_024590 [Carnegiea gigantea]
MATGIELANSYCPDTVVASSLGKKRSRTVGLLPPRGTAPLGFCTLRKIPHCYPIPSVADHPLGPATDRCLGKLLPHQLGRRRTRLRILKKIWRKQNQLMIKQINPFILHQRSYPFQSSVLSLPFNSSYAKICLHGKDDSFHLDRNENLTTSHCQKVDLLASLIVQSSFQRAPRSPRSIETKCGAGANSSL